MTEGSSPVRAIPEDASSSVPSLPAAGVLVTSLGTLLENGSPRQGCLFIVGNTLRTTMSGAGTQIV